MSGRCGDDQKRRRLSCLVSMWSPIVLATWNGTTSTRSMSNCFSSTIRFGSEEFIDRQDLSVEDFYLRMANTEDLPQTACPSPGAFEQAFRNARDAGAEAVVCLTISTDLSTTFQSALTAAATCEGALDVHVIDSRTVSSGLGTLVIEAGRNAAEGADIDAVLHRVSDLIARTHVLAALNTLETLEKGGRIGGATAMVGSLLSIKPVIDLSGGVVHEAGKARTRKRALQMLYERMERRRADRARCGDALWRTGHRPVADDRPPLSSTGPSIGTLGAVVGVHGGAQMIGVSWIAAA